MKKRKTSGPEARDLRRRAEAKLAAKGETFPAGHEKRLLHELETHRIELEMQNEELLRARAEAETALERYMQIFDFAPVGYVLLDATGAIRNLNLAASRLLGLERLNALDRRFARFVTTEDALRFDNFLGQMRMNQPP